MSSLKDGLISASVSRSTNHADLCRKILRDRSSSAAWAIRPGGEGPGAARVIAGTISPSTGKAPTEEPNIYQVESVLLWLHDGTALAISPGEYWDTGTVRANRYDFHAIWSPNGRLVIELTIFAGARKHCVCIHWAGREDQCCRSI